MGITPPSSLDDEDLSKFYVDGAFTVEPGPARKAPGPFEYMQPDDVMNYGDFLLERFNNPTVKYKGDMGAYKREMGLGGEGPGITSQYPYPYPMSTAMAPAVVPPVVPPVQTANPFLPGSNLPFSTYGTAAHGTQFGVDQRMFSADGGRIGYAGGADYYANLYSKYAQDMIKDGNTPMPIEDFVAIIKEQERTGNAQGGRIGYADGTDLAIKESLEAFQRYLKAGGKLGYKDFIDLGNEGVSKFFNAGGRVGFADGTDDPKRRTFMKVMAVIASLPILGKFFKPAVPLVKKLSNTTTKMPDWFPDLINKVMFSSTGKKIDADLTIYEPKELPGISIGRYDEYVWHGQPRRRRVIEAIAPGIDNARATRRYECWATGCTRATWRRE